MKRICVWGTSLKKVGDEAQNIAFVRIIRNRYPGVRITLFSQYGERMTRLVADEGIEVETIRTAHLFKVVRALARSNLFIFEGGPFYEDPWQAMRCVALFLIAKLFRLPVVVYGATAFHFKTLWGRFIYRTIFNHMDAITVREPIAVEIIKDLGVNKEVSLFADPRFILESPSHQEVREILKNEGMDPDKPYLTITTRYLHAGVPRWVKRSHAYDQGMVDRANEAIGGTVAYLEDRAQMVVLPMHPTYQEDQEMVRVIQGYMRTPSRLKLLSRRYSALEMIGLIHHSQLLIASRLGSAVFATLTGTPVVAIAYEPRMHDHMRRIGMERHVHDWKHLTYEKLVKDLEEVWTGRNQFREDMKQKAGAFRAMAWKNSELLSQYI